LKRAGAHLALLAGAALLVWLVFERAGLDRRMTALAYDPVLRGFPLRHSWPLERLGHDALKWLMLAFWVACLAWRPLRVGALYMALAAVTVWVLKHSSGHSCPWDLSAYGAESAVGPGRCSPAGHPVVGFALFGLYFALRDERPRAARAALLAAWIIGLAAGAVQIARGAHFASHVLWTAWVAWTVTLAAAALAGAAPARRPA
jgi:membrane-associated PAP2 superfamily phosphatase